MRPPFLRATVGATRRGVDERTRHAAGGFGLIFFALREVFQQRFIPNGGGSLSRVLMRAVWRAFRRVAVHRPASLVLAGPCAFLAVIASWSALLVVGWALVFWPRMPGEFLYAPGLADPGQGGFLGALYLSLVTLATLGFGDIVPTSGPLRVLVPFEALSASGCSPPPSRGCSRSTPPSPGARSSRTRRTLFVSRSARSGALWKS